MRAFSIVLLLAGLISAPAAAQKLEINLASVAAKASDKTELDLTGPALDIVKRVAAAAAPERQKLFAGIDSIAVRTYEFDKSGQYSSRDLEDLRKQVGSGSGWSRVLNTKDKDDETEIYVFNKGGKIAGVLLIDAGSDELTVVQISGTVELAQLHELIQSTIQYTGGAQ